MTQKSLAFLALMATALSSPSPAAPTENIAVAPLRVMNSALLQPRNTTLVEIQQSPSSKRNVSVWVTTTGQAIIDGDVVSMEQDFLLARLGRPPSTISTLTNSTDEMTKRAFSVRYLTGATWPNARVQYKYADAATETTISGVVNGAINEWRSLAPYLFFDRRATSSAPENGVVIIRANPADGCVASIGFANSPGLFMNLAPGGCGIPEATHEFGHTLGTSQYLISQCFN